MNSYGNIQPQDTIEIYNLFTKTLENYASDILAAKETCRKLIRESRRVQSVKWESKSVNFLGVLHYLTGGYDSARIYYERALQLSDSIHFEDFSYKIVGNLGLLYSKLGDYNKAIEMLYRSLEVSEKRNDSVGMAKKYADIGNTYQFLKNNKKSFVYLDRAYKIFVALNDSGGQANVLNSLGSLSQDRKDYRQALLYYNKSLEIKLKLGDKKGAVNSYINIANVYDEQKRSDQALDFFLKALELTEQSDDKESQAIIYNDIGCLYKQKNDWQKAEEYLMRSYETAKAIRMMMMVKTSSMNLSDLYDKTGDYKKALDYCRIYYKTRLELSDDNISQQIAEIESKYETEKKDKEIIKKDAELVKKQAEASRKEMQRNAFIAGFVIILLSAFLLLRLFNQKRRANRLLARQNIEILQQKEEISTQRDEIQAQRDLVLAQKEKIEEIHKKVTDSITYAKRIQNAVLPSSEQAVKILGEHFILFKPKDVVSGDFYWATKVNEWLIVVVADCTGHGVPGAFMSMLGISFLNEIVRKKEITEAAQVLDHLRESVVEALKQSREKVEEKEVPSSMLSAVKDGMDIALIALNTETLELQFAGANNPLYIVGSRQYAVSSESPDCQLPTADCQLIELKGDKMPVAIYERMLPFTNHKVQLQKGDVLYLASDGFQDQFGGPAGRKYLSKNFRNLLLSVSDKPMNVQKEIIESVLIQWKGDGEQMDDITVMGLKV